jgi:hypothetical protein
MIEKYLDFHFEGCYKNEFHNYCKSKPSRVILCIKSNFYLITFHDCIVGEKYEFVKNIVQALVSKFKIYEKYEIYRGYEVEKNVREFRLKNQNLRKTVLEVNYLYSNCTGKEFAITTEVPFFDALCNEEILLNNYNKANEYLEKAKYHWLQDNLKDLMHYNLYRLSDCETYKTIDHLIKSINTLTK